MQALRQQNGKRPLCQHAMRPAGVAPLRPGLGVRGAAPRRRAPAPPSALAASASAPQQPAARGELDDDGSEDSGAQHLELWRQAESEESRSYRRTVFSFQQWQKHRSNRRYLHHLSTLAASRIVRGVLPPVMVVSAFATFVSVYHWLHAAGRLAECLPPLPVVPVEPFQLTSFALALLLVFRTNAAHARWHEARCVFGRINDAARDVWRQVLAVFPRDRPSARAAVGRWLVAYCYAAKWALREEGRQRAELEGWMPPRELDALMASKDAPQFAILVLSHTLRAHLAGQQLVKLMESIGSMMYDLSSCNRILTTPIPLSYTRHTTRFMVLWLLLLPLALWAKCGWGCVPTVALVSLALLTIEAIGVSLEEPFTILALEDIAEGCAKGIHALAAMDEAAAAAAAAAAPYGGPPAAAAAAAAAEEAADGGGAVAAAAAAAAAAATNGAAAWRPAAAGSVGAVSGR
ncbi:hypothetical protein Rsub_04850 [Raphidocelis subcapitata]|uniref:Uncharacterized protein n=1 Tax=Raphidocelis subcapitata TaxID=307507 RepID=A0A2V0NU66_9CHLO|nr:hypothetical protein Rsub_04850 [Raphidocelis subcapitata]|eukprot:GBF91181.1 hypothetical protein Rsub_04850 [Raphidocelis subcapitata]